MADLQANLETYYLQLQQVEAALISDPANDELIKLKADLTEVIDLTKDLLAQQGSMDSEDDGISSSGTWKVGDKCMAPWSQDGQYYEAVIEEVHADGKVSIGFTEYSQGDITEMSKLKSCSEVKPSSSRPSAVAGPSGSAAKRIAPKESLAESHQTHPVAEQSVDGHNVENQILDYEEKTNSRCTTSDVSKNLPSLLEISPFDINPPKPQRQESNKASPISAKNNNIPSLLSLDVTFKDNVEPVSLLSLNFESPQRLPASSLVNPMLFRGGSDANLEKKSNRIPSLFDCDMSGLHSSAQSNHPVLITSPNRHMIVPGIFPNNFQSSPSHASFPNQGSIPSLLSQDISWMDCERERVTLVSRNPIGSPRGRRLYCYNCCGYDHSVSGCNYPKNYFKRQGY